MKDFVFISDFDGTLTNKDFYHIVMEKYHTGRFEDVYQEWMNGKIGVFQFLNTVFSSMDRSEEEIFETILEIEFDPFAKTFIESVKKAGGDFVILSAGTGYYIEKLLQHLGIKDITIISNPGLYKDRGIHMTADTKSPYYSPTYGVDKALALLQFKKDYKKVYYAGDSEPDLRAAVKADITFARGGLQTMLKELKHPFIPVENFSEIQKHLEEMGVI